MSVLSRTFVPALALGLGTWLGLGRPDAQAALSAGAKAVASVTGAAHELAPKVIPPPPLIVVQVEVVPLQTWKTVPVHCTKPPIPELQGAEELPVAGRHYFFASGQVPGVREIQSHNNAAANGHPGVATPRLPAADSGARF